MARMAPASRLMLQGVVALTAIAGRTKGQGDGFSLASSCSDTTDLMFLLENGPLTAYQSGTNFADYLLPFAADVAAGHTIGNTGSHVGLSHHASYGVLGFALDESFDGATVDANIRNLETGSGGLTTNVSGGLDHIRNVLMNENAGLRAQGAANRVLVVVITGHDTSFFGIFGNYREKEAVEAEIVRALGVTVVVVAVDQSNSTDLDLIGPPDLTRLSKIASTPSNTFIIEVNGFGNLTNAVNAVVEVTCSSRSPSTAPSTSTPSAAPSTSTPSASPASSAPSASPASTAPSDAPASTAPSAAPSTSVPSAAPSTSAPSTSPTAPSFAPSTSAPTTSLPTATPTSSGATWGFPVDLMFLLDETFSVDDAGFANQLDFAIRISLRAGVSATLAHVGLATQGGLSPPRGETDKMRLALNNHTDYTSLSTAMSSIARYSGGIGSCNGFDLIRTEMLNSTNGARTPSGLSGVPRLLVYVADRPSHSTQCHAQAELLKVENVLIYGIGVEAANNQMDAVSSNGHAEYVADFAALRDGAFDIAARLAAAIGNVTASPSQPPTLSPTTSPTISPTTSDPTVSPTKFPTTLHPTAAPTTSMPTDVPTNSCPGAVDASWCFTITDRNSCVTGTSVRNACPDFCCGWSFSPTSAPTIAPTESAPSKAPTQNPTTSDPSRSPSTAPSTSTPSAAPSTLSSSITTSPTGSPTLQSPADDSSPNDATSEDSDGSSTIATVIGTALGTAAVMGLAFVLHNRRSRAGERLPKANAGPRLPPDNARRHRGPEPLYNTIDETAVGRGATTAINADYEAPVANNPSYVSAPATGSAGTGRDTGVVHAAKTPNRLQIGAADYDLPTLAADYDLPTLAEINLQDAFEPTVMSTGRSELSEPYAGLDGSQYAGLQGTHKTYGSQLRGNSEI